MKTDNLTFFHQATSRLCSSLDIEVVLSSCFDFIKRHLKLDGIYFNVFNTESGIIENIASASDSGVDLSGRSIPVLDEHLRFIEKTRIGEVHIIDSSSENPMTKLIRGALGVKDLSFMVILLGIEGHRIGTLGLYAKGGGIYTDDHAHLIKMIHDPLAIAFSNTLRYREILRLKELLADDNRYLARELHHTAGDEIIGAEYGLSKVIEMVRQVAPLNNHLLLLGETGVGKEVIANAIHYSSPRADKPFIRVNCGAIPETLIDSELFGHEKGAFTGAVFQKRGRFERADKGTIFLDEIGELPMAAQQRLLRVLQNKELERVGGDQTLTVDARIVAATNRNLEEMVRIGQFREDLWFRLNVYPIHIPPLRERTSDIPAFVNYFIEKKTKELKLPFQPVPDNYEIEKLLRYPWPGNVRELENIVERALINCLAIQDNQQLTFEINESGANNRSTLEPYSKNIESLDEIIRSHIRRTLLYTNGRVEGKNGAAGLLKVNPSTLRNRMTKLGIPYGKTVKD